MDEILNFIFRYCSGFIKKYGFHVTDACISESFGNAYIVFENNNIVLQFTRDRGQLCLVFYSKYDKNKTNQISIAWIRQLVTGENEYHSFLDDDHGRFLEGHFDRIMQLFEKDNTSQTIEKLKILKRKRAKALFG